MVRFFFGQFSYLTWGSFGGLYYGYIIAISTGISWMISREKKSLPLTPLSVMTLIFDDHRGRELGCDGPAPCLIKCRSIPGIGSSQTQPFTL
jgi:hypothetical protein